MLIMDIKGTFDHVSRNDLLRKIDGVCADRDLVRWTSLFILEQNISLLADGDQCKTAEVEMEAPQGLAVSLILFAFYLSKRWKK